MTALSPLPSLPAGILDPRPPQKLLATLPFSPAAMAPSAAALRANLPPWPSAEPTAPEIFPRSWPSPLSELPAAQPAASTQNSTPFTVAAPTPVPQLHFTQAAEPAADFTDDDLRDAFGPIVEQAVRKAVYAQENGIDTYLEPMLRATIRRALAEYSPSSKPFRSAAALDRAIWHLQALFTSRTYEDILFEKTHRFQVEEVFLLDAASLALVSFASCDPARHASAHRVASTVSRIGLQLRDDQGKTRPVVELPTRRNALSRSGKFVILVAVVRGRSNELLIADLEFSLRRIEDRFREHFLKKGTPLMLELQPFLEDCLLIQAPACAA
jgi:hypothetical protein